MTNMIQIWKEQIDEINEIIRDIEICKDGRLMQLERKKASLNTAFLRCFKETI